jgi:FkbM family methyltransferase
MKGECTIVEMVMQRMDRVSPTIIDVGAYDGWHLLQFYAQTGGRGQYIAIEAARPKPSTWPCNARWISAIASDVEGEADWYASDAKHPGSGSTLPPVPNIGDIYEGMTFTQAPRRASIRIDSLCHRLAIDEINLLWLDVQGAELQVLRGCGDMLNRTGLIAVEVHAGEYVGAPNQAQIAAMLGPRFLPVTPMTAGHMLFEATR